MTCVTCNGTGHAEHPYEWYGTEQKYYNAGRELPARTVRDACQTCAVKAEIDYHLRDMYRTGIIPENVIELRRKA